MVAGGALGREAGPADGWLDEQPTANTTGTQKPATRLRARRRTPRQQIGAARIGIVASMTPEPRGRFPGPGPLEIPQSC